MWSRSLIPRSLDDVCQFAEVSIARFAGPLACLELSAASSFFCRSLHDVLPIILCDCPGWICICGSRVDGASGSRFLSDAAYFNPAEGAWTVLPSLTEGRRCSAVATVAGWFYVCGGDAGGCIVLNSVHRISPATTCVWETAPALLQGRWGASAAGMARQLYVCGGDIGFCCIASTERFCLRKGAWQELPAMSARRWKAAAATARDRFYVCGGHDGEQSLRSCDCFDSTSQTWRLIAPMKAARWGAAAAVVDTKLHVCGGEDDLRRSCDVETYDLQNSCWEQLQMPMLHARVCAVGCAVSGNIYVFGGYCDMGLTACGEVLGRYQKTWTVGEDLPTELQLVDGMSAAVLLP